MRSVPDRAGRSRRAHASCDRANVATRPAAALRAARLAAAMAAAGLFSGCSMIGGWFGHLPPGVTPDNAPTLKTLAKREIVIAPDSGVPADEDKAIAAYRAVLSAAPDPRQRAEALRRLGDLSMASADNANAKTPTVTGTPDYSGAIAEYRRYLQATPDGPDNDRVLYQLARAQEQGGQLEDALATLDQLVAKHPTTRYRDEAEFRRGELLFSMRHYAKAEVAYTTVLHGDSANPFREQAQYMQGWSLYKQGRLEDALNSFFGVLDERVAGVEGDDLASLQGLSRADRELVEDTFRVTSISLAALQGAESIPPYMTTETRRSYEFRVYQQLAELYLKQDRPKDAADTEAAFAARDPLDEHAAVMQARVVEIYAQAGFEQQALAAKKAYVAQYGLHGEFAKAQPEAWQKAQPLVKSLLAELAQRSHASAQKTHLAADYDDAFHWYRALLEEFPADADAARNNFLLAELLYEHGRYADAATEYEKTAYDYPAHEHSADAGYAALLAYGAQEKGAAAGDVEKLQRATVDSEQRFAAAFAEDKRAPVVLANAADTLYALHDNDRASTVARQVLAWKPEAPAEQRRVAWTVAAHTAFEAGRFDEAETSYREVLALAPANDSARPQLSERLAASIYKQGEAARTAGDLRVAADNFARVADAAPQSAVRTNAEYDQAAALIALKDWAGAAKTLEDFRTRYPKSPLQADVPARLALAYGEQQKWPQAAAEYERVAQQDDGKPDSAERARAAQWQAAELYQKAADGAPTSDAARDRAAASRAYEAYLKRFPQPLETAVEARGRLAAIAHADGNAAAEMTWQKAVFAADQGGGAARTDRTRRLGAEAALALARPADDDYRKVQLVEPLARQLKLKKAKMEDALKAYAVASDYGVADVTTAATYHVAALYQDFAHALNTSERPKKLSKLEREQYDVMLEEQAYPFEEKAIELHTANAHRAGQGVWDDWVRKSFAALRELQPARWGKTELSAGGIDAIR
jgi:tetratricopeptide (TPR) repeat protein